MSRAYAVEYPFGRADFQVRPIFLWGLLHPFDFWARIARPWAV
jgi:hypothetical protein